MSEAKGLASTIYESASGQAINYSSRNVLRGVWHVCSSILGVHILGNTIANWEEQERNVQL